MGLRLFYFQTKAIICSPVGHAYDAYGRTPLAPATPCPLHPTRAAGRMVEKNRHFQSWRARLWHVMTNPKVLEGNLDILEFLWGTLICTPKWMVYNGQCY